MQRQLTFTSAETLISIVMMLWLYKTSDYTLLHSPSIPLFQQVLRHLMQ